MARVRDLTYIAFDLEATCHPSLRYHEVIEIGAVRLEPKTLEITNSFEKLVRPSTPIIQPIIEKTGITDKLVHNASSISDIWDEFLAFVGSAILVGHQASLDVGILKRTAKRHSLVPLNNFVLDTMRLARRLYPNQASYGLEQLQKLLNIKMTAHRAKADAHVTGSLFKHFVELLEDKYSISEYKELRDFCYSKNPLQAKLF